MGPLCGVLSFAPVAGVGVYSSHGSLSPRQRCLRHEANSPGFPAPDSTLCFSEDVWDDHTPSVRSLTCPAV